MYILQICIYIYNIIIYIYIVFIYIHIHIIYTYITSKNEEVEKDTEKMRIPMIPGDP